MPRRSLPRWLSMLAGLLLGCSATAAPSTTKASSAASRTDEGATPQPPPDSKDRLAVLLDEGWSCPPGWDAHADDGSKHEAGTRRLGPREAVCERGGQRRSLMPPHADVCRMRWTRETLPPRPEWTECASCSRDNELAWERRRQMPRREYWICELCYQDDECSEGEICAPRALANLPTTHPARAAAAPYAHLEATSPLQPSIYAAMRPRVCGSP